MPSVTNEQVRCFVFRWFAQHPFVKITATKMTDFAKAHFKAMISREFVLDSINLYIRCINENSTADESVKKEPVGKAVRGFVYEYWLERNFGKKKKSPTGDNLISDKEKLC